MKPSLPYGRKLDRVPEDKPTREVFKPGQCFTLHCRKKPRKRPGHRERFCQACKSRRWKIQSPERYSFNKLKSNAKRRGIPFVLTPPPVGVVRTTAQSPSPTWANRERPERGSEEQPSPVLHPDHSANDGQRERAQAIIYDRSNTVDNQEVKIQRSPPPHDDVDC